MFFLNNNISVIENYLAISWKINNNPKTYTFFDLNSKKEKNLYSNPIYLFDAFDIDISSIEIINDNSYINLSFYYNYQENIIQDYNNYFYNDNLYSDLNIDIYLNNRLIEQEYYIDSFYKYNDSEEIELCLERNVLEEDTILRIELSSSDGYNETEIIDFSNLNQSLIEINFNNLESKILLPYKYQNNKISYEEIYFLKLFKNNLNFPKNIKPLLLIYYPQKINNNKLVLNDISEAKITAKGIEDNQLSFNLDYFQYNNLIIIYIDQYFYYDNENKLTKKGNSNNFYSKNSLILPWDYSDNLINIDFSFNTSSYIDRQFNIHFSFNVQNSLRGKEDSKYSFKFDEDFSDFPIENENLEIFEFLIPVDNYDGEVNYQDLEEWYY